MKRQTLQDRIKQLEGMLDDLHNVSVLREKINLLTGEIVDARKTCGSCLLTTEYPKWRLRAEMSEGAIDRVIEYLEGFTAPDPGNSRHEARDNMRLEILERVKIMREQL